MTTLDLDRAQPQIRALARALGWERREVIQALQAHAEIPQAEHKMAPAPQRWPFVLAPVAPKPVPKFEYIRSKPLMAAYRLIPCQHCGANDGTVCGAHSNWAVHGKGKSIKASDIYAASLCHECHAMLDQGAHMSEVERKAIWWNAHVNTVRQIVLDGRWPSGVPIPTEDCPW